MKSSHYGLDMLGYTRAARSKNKKMQKWKIKQIFKNRYSTNRKVKFLYVKLESLVIVNKCVTMNNKSNFAHTAHHTRRVAFLGNSQYCGFYIICLIKRFSMFYYRIADM